MHAFVSPVTTRRWTALAGVFVPPPACTWSTVSITEGFAKRFEAGYTSGIHAGSQPRKWRLRQSLGIR